MSSDSSSSETKKAPLKERINAVCTDGWVFFNDKLHEGKCEDFRKLNCAYCDGFGFCEKLRDKGFVARGTQLEEQYLRRQEQRRRIYISIIVGLSVLLFLQAIVLPRTNLSPFLEEYMSGMLPSIVEYSISTIIGVISGLITYWITSARNKKPHRLPHIS